MKATLGFSLMIILYSAFMQNAIADNSPAEQSALDAQSARLAAVVDADIAVLEKYLADDLSYSHTTGLTETKAEFLSTVASKSIDYVSAPLRDVNVRIYDNMAVITGLSDLELIVGGNPVNFTIRFLEVSRHMDNTWRLVAWQSVKFTAK